MGSLQLMDLLGVQPVPSIGFCCGVEAPAIPCSTFTLLHMESLLPMTLEEFVTSSYRCECCEEAIAASIAMIIMRVYVRDNHGRKLHEQFTDYSSILK